jgi:outer membrane protein assembly factor BamA
MKKFFLLLLLLPSALFSSVTIQFEGLTRTSLAELKNRLHLKEYTNTPFTAVQQEKLISSIRQLGVFSDVTANTKEEDGATLVTISVREKWTLFPFPMFRTSGSKTSFGAFLLEMNVFGLLKTMYSGVMFSNDGISVMGGFMDPSLFGSRFSWNAFALYGKDIFEDSTARGDIFRRYKSEKLSFTIGLGYTVSNPLMVSIFTEYKNSSIISESSEFAPPDSASILSFGTRIQFNKQVFRSWFPEGMMLNFQGAASLTRRAETDSGYSLKLTGQQNIAIGSQTRWGLSCAAGISALPETMQERIGGKPGYMTLPANTLIARDYWSVSTQIEYQLINLSWATITGLVFAEYGAFTQHRGDWLQFYGPGAGMRVYLKKVALPAMGLDVSWNLRNHEVFAGFTVGLHM